MRKQGAGTRLAALALVMSAAVAACAPGEDNAAIDTGMLDTAARDMGDAGMTDAAALGTVAAVHSAEIEAGRLAQQRGTNADVKRWAQQIEQEHAAFMERLQAMPWSIDTTAADPALVQSATSTLARLRNLSGAAFDTAWVNAQVTLHEAALERAKDIADHDFDDAGGQAGSADTLEEYLDNTVEVIEKHLREARELQERLRGATR